MKRAVRGLEPNISFLGKGYDTSIVLRKNLKLSYVFCRNFLSTVDSCRSYLDDRNRVVTVFRIYRFERNQLIYFLRDAIKFSFS